MEREESATSEWILATLWLLLLAGTMYALAIDDDGLFQLMTAAMVLLVGLTLLLQRRLAAKRDIN